METINIDCEIELGTENRPFFVLLSYNPFEMYVDLSVLPQAATLCLLADGCGVLNAMCGEDKNIQRRFVNSNWVINEWGGDKELVNAIKKSKQRLLDDLPDLMKKYPSKNS